MRRRGIRVLFFRRLLDSFMFDVDHLDDDFDHYYRTANDDYVDNDHDHSATMTAGRSPMASTRWG